ncbi:MAG: TetR/AcrR family transcriptional regulator [Erysipelotrichaceae bacterium]|nr:TetR/AcrR family transcriptional regulator [Erysipelotrichaceae bacterium]
MAPRKTIHQTMILDGAISVMEQLGYEKLSVRNIANQLKISTQPIYTEFKNIEDLKQHLVKYIQNNYLQQPKKTYKDFALCYLYFAKEHKELFKFLYLRKRNGMKELDDINYELAISFLAESLDLDTKIAKDLHQRMQIYCYSLGVMIATDYQEYSYDQINTELSHIFRIMLSYYKQITNEQDFGYWLDKTHHLYYK